VFVRLTLACAVASAPLAAQSFPAFDALELGFGVAKPTAATGASTLGVAADLDFGRITSRDIHVIAGFDAAESEGNSAIRLDGQPVTGSYSMAGGRVGLRWDILGTRPFTPFIIAMVAGQTVHSETEDDRADQFFNRLSWGPVFGAGLSRVLDAQGHIAATAQISREFLGSGGHWRVGFGLRFSIFDWHDRSGEPYY